MRFEGTLKRWNDDKGYGFIAPAAGGADVFVHVSAFPRDGQRPVLDEALTFEMERGADGRMKALRVQRTRMQPLRATVPATSRPLPRAGVPAPRASGGRSTTLAWLLAVVLVGAGAYGYHLLTPRPQAVAPRATPAEPVPAKPLPMAVPEPVMAPAAPRPVSPTVPAASGRFACDGRTHCSQMTSCEESRYFLKHCPGVQMDGNHDGEPCEQQWCTSPWAR